MKISIASYAFHGLVAEGKMDVFGYLETCKYRYHVDRADIWNGMLPTTDDEFIQKVRDEMDARGMVLANLCVDGAHAWDDNPEERERLHQSALAHLNAAVILGAETVRIDVGGERGGTMSDEMFDHVVKTYRKYAEFAADHGFRVGPENHWGPSRTPDAMLKIVGAVDHPAYGILLHFGGWNEEVEDTFAADKAVAPHVMHTHVMHRIVEGPDFEDRLKLLADLDYDGTWGVEHHTAQNEYIEVEWQLGAVKRALRHIGVE